MKRGDTKITCGSISISKFDILESALIDFVERVSSEHGVRSEKEIEILPKIVEILKDLFDESA